MTNRTIENRLSSPASLILRGAIFLSMTAFAPVALAETIGSPWQKPAAQATAAKLQKEQQASSSKGQDATRPARRKAINGVGSVYSLSKLNFPSSPDTVNELEFVYTFPDRCRWKVSPYKAPKKGKREDRTRVRTQAETVKERDSRRQYYRFGSSLWMVPPKSTASQSISGESRRRTLLGFELRRIALVWPADLNWESKGDMRTAEIKGLGKFEAELDPKTQMPIRMGTFNPEGVPEEQLTDMQWQSLESGGTPAPKSWSFHSGGQHIWNEEFLNQKRNINYREAYFRPHDVRKTSGIGASSPQPIRTVTPAEVPTWRMELPEEAQGAWDLSIVEVRAVMEHWKPLLKEAGHTLDERPAFLLDENGLPTQIELRMKSANGSLPDEWKIRGGLPALAQVSQGVRTVNASAVKRMMQEVPAGHVAGELYIVTQLTNRGLGICDLILPLVEKR